MKFLSNILVKAGLVVEGSTQLNSLAGVGTRMVVTNAAGVVSTQAIPIGSVTSVFGRSGVIVSQSGDYTTAQVTESGNLYYTDARARAAISSTATGLTYSAGVISLTAGYSIPTTASQANWDAAYAARITAANTPLSLVSGTLSITQAGASTNGFLSSADWNAFNSKVTGSSVAGRVAFFGGTSFIAGSSELVFDSANNRLGVSTAVPLAKIHITSEGTTGSTNPLLIQDNANVNLFYISDLGNIFVGSDGQAKQAKFFIHGITTSPFIDARSTGVTISSAANNDLTLNGNPIKFTSGATEIGRWFSTGNLRIQTGGTFADDLFKVDVQGTVRVTGNLTTNVVGSLLKTNGSGVLTAAIAGTDYQTPIVNPVTGTAAAGQVPYFTSASAVSGSNNLFWDNANGNLGIGTNSVNATWKLGVNGNVQLVGALSFGLLTANNSTGYIQVTGSAMDIYAHTSRILTFSANAAERARFHTNGNFSIGTISDLGRLGVVGDTLLRGSGNTNTTTSLTVENSDSVNMLRLLNDTTLKLGSQNVDIFPTANGSAVSNAGRGLIISTSAGSQGTGAVKIVGTSLDAAGSNWSLWLSHTFGASSGSATHSGLLLNQTVNQTSTANGVTRGLLVDPTLTAAVDFRAIEWSNNAPAVGRNSWGLYGSGTAPNYLAGALGIGSTSLAVTNLRISKNIEGGTSAYGVLVDGSIRSGVTAQALGFTSAVSLQNTAFTLSALRHFYAAPPASFGSATVTNQYGYFVETTLTGATNNYGFYGDLVAATGRWNLYMNGTAANYINGSLLIGSTANDNINKLQVTGTVVSGSRTSTEGSVLLRGYYTSGYLTTFGTDASSGGPMISYAVESAQNSTEANFVSSTPNVDTPRSAYTVSANHRWYTAAASTTAVGTAIALTKHMELYNSGNLVLGGGSDNATNRLQVAGSISATADSVINGVTIGKGGGSGALNTTVGSLALSANTTGASNTAFGLGALATITTGSDNVGVGTNAGRYRNGTTANSNSSGGVYIGNASRASAAATTNEIVIGAGAQGSGDNTVTIGNTGITATVLRGNVSTNGSVDAAGFIRSNASKTAAVNEVSIALNGNNITTYAAGFTMTAGGYGLNAIYAQHEQRFGGNATFNASNLVGGGLILNKLAPTAAGTVTMGQVGSGRTMSNLHLMTQFEGNNNLTVTHMSGLHIYGHYRTSGSGTLTVSGAYYGILLADPNEFGAGATVTGDNWGFYQVGATPTNYFGGSVLVGTTTTDADNKVVVNGSVRASQFRLSAMNAAPATATSTGTLGEIRITADHIYVCVATNTWERVAIATF